MTRELNLNQLIRYGFLKKINNQKMICHQLLQITCPTKKTSFPIELKETNKILIFKIMTKY